MPRVKTIAIFFLIFNCSIVSATRYYVKNDGNDALNGRSAANAWKTLERVNRQRFVPGDTILLNRGDVWRGTLDIASSGVADRYIVFSCFGSGLKPRILGSAQATSWTSVGENIWQSGTSITDPFEAKTGNVFFMTSADTTLGVHKVYVSGHGNLKNEHDWDFDGKTLCVWSETDPSLRYSSVEAAQRDYAIYLNGGQYVKVLSIDMFFTRSSGVHGSPYKTGLYGFWLMKCEIAYIGYPDEYGYGSHLLYNSSVFSYNNIHHCGRRGISLYNYGSADISNVYVQYNTFHHGYHTTGVDVAAGSLSGNTGDIYNVFISNNLFYEPEYERVSNTTWISLIGSTKSTGFINGVYVYSNVFRYTGGAGFYTLSGVKSLQIYNNTFYGFNKIAKANVFFILLRLNSGNQVQLKNNIFYNDADYDVNTTAICISLQGSMLYKDVNANHNLYYTTDSRTFLVSSDPLHRRYVSSTFSNLESDLLWETHSPDPQDPLFISSSDFHLQNNSPAIGKGEKITSVTLKTDFQGKQYNNPPSIGAYEGNPPLTTPDTVGSSSVKLYPNPADDLITVSREGVSLDQGNIKIFNLSGELVFTSILDKGVALSTFPIFLNAGIYIVQIIVGNVIVACLKLIINS